ncbi:kinase domain-containing protein [Chaetomium fimeti]|uniref:non-specific serine/threonine protein kinase n=1 Tax=Chaetomium fimeti TaxID=1854472 RepID=A0AAE0HHP0_9PEZI|nr:kinase domain-containing protein [Chaetomium fimeti]
MRAPSLISPSTRAIWRLPSCFVTVLHPRTRYPHVGSGRAFSTTTSTKGHDKEFQRPAYNPISDVEYLEYYIPGGYHPVTIGDVLRARYRVVDKLGFGGYSTVWLAQDTKLGCYVAVKVGIVKSPPRETAILRDLATPLPVPPPASLGHSSIPVPLDEFEVKGPNGTHPCYTMALAQCDLRTASYSQLFQIDVARALCGGVALAVAYLHARGYAHGDIHLGNILARLPRQPNQLSIAQFYDEHGKPETIPITRRDGNPLPPNIPPTAVAPLNLAADKRAHEFSLGTDTQILLSDFGEAHAPASEPRPGRDCHTPLGSRPPEARFEPDAPLSYPADVWGLAITMWEIVGMKAIFSNEFTTADEVTAQQVDVLGYGGMPLGWWERWEGRGRFFGEDKRPQGRKEVRPALEDAFEEFVQKYRRKRAEVGVFGEEETAAIVDLMRKMLAFRPEERPTADEVLKSEWMVKWVLPDFERGRQRAGREVSDSP